MNDEKNLVPGKRRLTLHGRRREAAPPPAPTEPKPKNPMALAKGSPDIPMILITAGLVLFGCVMIYSASAVSAEQYHCSVLKRYI